MSSYFKDHPSQTGLTPTSRHVVVFFQETVPGCRTSVRRSRTQNVPLGMFSSEHMKMIIYF